MIRTISPQDMREMERAFLEGTGYPSILLTEDMYSSFQSM